jgi:hypothetical protein
MAEPALRKKARRQIRLSEIMYVACSYCSYDLATYFQRYNSAGRTGPADPAFAGPIFNSPQVGCHKKGRQVDACAFDCNSKSMGLSISIHWACAKIDLQ